MRYLKQWQKHFGMDRDCKQIKRYMNSTRKSKGVQLFHSSLMSIIHMHMECYLLFSLLLFSLLTHINFMSVVWLLVSTFNFLVYFFFLFVKITHQNLSILVWILIEPIWSICLSIALFLQLCFSVTIDKS